MGGFAASVDADVGKPFDIQGFVDKALKAGERRVVVPPGRYRVTPHDRVHLRLIGLRDVTIIADGVEMICTETTTALLIQDCTRVTVRGLSIDYDPLPFTQGRITAISPDKSEHIISLFDGYPDAGSVLNFKYEIFRPDARTLRCDAEMRPTYYPSAVGAISDPRHVRVKKGQGLASDPEQVGDIVVIASQHAPGGVMPHAVYLERCDRVDLADINVWASNCFAFVEFGCNGTTYRRCRVDRRPPKTDPTRRADPRIRSTNADAFHCIDAVKGPSIIDCTARFMGDDAVNIQGSYSMVTACADRTLRVLLKCEGLPPGEPVELWTYEGVRLPDAVVTATEPAGDITSDERAFVIRQAMDERTRTQGLAKAVSVTLDRAVEMPIGSLIAPAKRVGNGFLVKGCDFGSNRSRGIVMKGSNGQVVGNRITGGWMSAVLVSPEYWWLEAGSSCDVRIADNVITDCGGTPIVVEARGGSGRVAPAGVHRDIAIEDNRITGCPMPAIRVTSTRRLTVRGNRIARPTGPAGTDPVVLDQCTEVTNGANTVK